MLRNKRKSIVFDLEGGVARLTSTMHFGNQHSNAITLTIFEEERLDEEGHLQSHCKDTTVYGREQLLRLANTIKNQIQKWDEGVERRKWEGKL